MTTDTRDDREILDNKNEEVKDGLADLPLLGVVALEQGAINKSQLVSAIEHCRKERLTGRNIRFEDVLIEQKIVSPDLVEALIVKSIRKMNREFCELVVEKGIVSRQHANNALALQAKKYKEGELILVSDLMITAGILTAKERDMIYGLQNERVARFYSDCSEDTGSGADGTGDFRESEEYQKDLLMGELAVTYSFITREDLEIGVKYLDKAYRKKLKISLERILLEKGFLDEKKATHLRETKNFLSIRDLDAQFVILAVEKGFITREIGMKMLEKQLEEFDQRKRCVSLPEIVVDEKLMTVEHCNVILSKQKREPLEEEPENVIEQAIVQEETKSIYDDGDSTGNIHPEIAMGSEIVLNVSEDLLAAVVIIPVNYPEPVTLEMIKKRIEEKNISHGLVTDEAIEEQIAQDETEVRQFVVAKGKPPVQGKDAELRVNFPREYLNPGRVTGDGMIDFKDRGAVPFCEEGSVLVEIIPEVEGVHGIDVYSDLIAPGEVKGVTVTAGKGCRFSEDRLKIIATETGNPSMTVAGDVSVCQEIIIKGDVDYNTGNIVFDGHIIVRGVVKEGFSVVGGSLTVKEIDGANIDLKGNLEVSGGILDANIKLEGNLQCMFLAESSVEAYSDVIVKKEITGSTIYTSGACKSDGTAILTSEISAMNGIEAAVIGTDVSEKCILTVGTTAHTDKVINKVKEQIEKKKNVLDEKQKPLTATETEQAEYHKKISEAAQIQDDGEARIRMLKEALGGIEDAQQKTEILAEIAELEATTKAVEEKITGYFEAQDILMNEALELREECEAIVEEIEKLNSIIQEIRNWAKQQARSASVKTLKEIRQGTVIRGQNATYIANEDIKNSTVREVEGNLLQGEPKWVMKVLNN